MDQDRATALLDQLHQAQNRLYSGGDGSALRDLLAEDIVWTVPGDNAISGSYRGVDAVLGYFARRRDLADQTFRMHRRDLLVGSGDRIAALTDGTATIAGAEQSWSTLGLYEIRDGRIQACWLLPLDGRQFDAIWSGMA
jgi:ketosteroid isomerase-like protein